MAIAKEWMRKDPFYGYKMEQDETDPVFLTNNELQAIMNREFDIPRLELVKDIFLFACFTGLAFADVSTLRPEHLEQDNNGDWWIRKGRVKLERRRKSSSIANVPLLPVHARTCIHKNDTTLCKSHGQEPEGQHEYSKEQDGAIEINLSYTSHNRL